MSQVTELRPSAKYQTQLWANILCIFVFLILPWVLLGFVPELGLLYVLIFLLANVLWLIPALILTPIYCRTVHYRLTERDLIVQRGILVKSEDVVPYTMVTNIAVRRGPIERLLGLATLHVHTAGYSQQAGTEAKIAGMEGWDRVHAQLLDLIHRSQGEEGVKAPLERGSAVSGATADAVPALLGQILAELRQLRVELGDGKR